MATNDPFGLERPNPFQMDADLTRDLFGRAKANDVREETALPCDADKRDHVHVCRVGDPGSGLRARGVLLAHEGERVNRIYLSAPRLRVLAAALLNVADEIDGKTPLAFFPPAPEVEEPER